MKGYIEAVDKLIAGLEALPQHHKLSLQEDSIDELILKVAAARPDEAPPEVREAAFDKYGTDDIEIDDTAYTSPADDGTWVSAWVWLPAPESEEEDE